MRYPAVLMASKYDKFKCILALQIIIIANQLVIQEMM